MSLSRKLHSLDRDVFYVAHPFIVSRLLPLGSTAALPALPAMSLAPVPPLVRADMRQSSPAKLSEATRLPLQLLQFMHRKPLMMDDWPSPLTIVSTSICTRINNTSATPSISDQRVLCQSKNQRGSEQQSNRKATRVTFVATVKAVSKKVTMSVARKKRIASRKQRKRYVPVTGIAATKSGDRLTERVRASY